MPSLNRDHFISSFPVCIPFISFSYLIALARTSTLVLERADEGGHLCLAPDLSGEASRFSPLNMMLACGVFKMFFMKLGTVASLLIITLMHEC